MAQDAPNQQEEKPEKNGDEPQKRENYVGKKPLDYSRFDDLDFESDEDDCHPNIEIGTWRRLKERMRREKGIKKKEPHLVDKWNVTTTNKNYHIDPKKPPKTTEEQKADKEERESQSTSNNNDNDNDTNTNTSNDANTKSEELKSADTSTEKEKEKATTNDTPAASSESKPSPPPKENDEQPAPKKQNKSKDKDEEIDDEPYKARSNPQTFLDENLEKLRKFAKIKKDSKADKFLKKNPELVHEASEGFLITYAVDRAVEGAEKPELARLSRRCLMVHNLVQSCSQQNVSPIIGVERFYSKIASNEQLIESYKVELNKQVKELMERIEVRRVERIAELQDIPDEYDEDEKAPLGPGGLDPTEVLNSLPKEMQDAFINQDVEGLKVALGQMDKDMAEYQMRRCIDAGLWVQPESDDEDGGNDNDQQQSQEVPTQQEEAPKEEVQQQEAPKKQVKVDELD